MSNKFWPAILKTGGSPGALDAIDGDLLTPKDASMIVATTGFYVYKLTTNASTETDPTVITPDANPGSKCWELLFSSSM